LLTLALSDLDASIQMEGHFVDAYWQRHLIYLTQNKKTEALNDLAVVLKLNRTHAGAYLSRYIIFIIMISLFFRQGKVMSQFLFQLLSIKLRNKFF
jgi:hypothetical protein